MKRSKQTLIAAAFVLVLIFVMSDALYVVSETDQVIITQFGEPMGDAVINPGVHIKMPFIQKTHYFEKRWMEWDGDPNQVPTRDKKYIWIDT